MSHARAGVDAPSKAVSASAGKDPIRMVQALPSTAFHRGGIELQSARDVDRICVRVWLSGACLIARRTPTFDIRAQLGCNLRLALEACFPDVPDRTRGANGRGTTAGGRNAAARSGGRGCPAAGVSGPDGARPRP